MVLGLAERGDIRRVLRIGAGKSFLASVSSSLVLRHAKPFVLVGHRLYCVSLIDSNTIPTASKIFIGHVIRALTRRVSRSRDTIPACLHILVLVQMLKGLFLDNHPWLISLSLLLDSLKHTFVAPALS